jgi:AcrR family transcriptional regulator
VATGERISTDDRGARSPRALAKAERRDELIRAATRLFADRGFAGVGIEDVGSAAGVSGPAVYRHFATKRALLGAILREASEQLHEGGAEVAASTPDPAKRVDVLIAFHIDFAVRSPDVIRVQDRDLASLSDEDRAAVRRLQRAYVEIWVAALCAEDPAHSVAEARLRAHAAFGLMNSTPHARAGATDAAARAVLTAMTRAALRA